ncbi:hypothetical protein ACSZOM_10300 [Aeromonas hydrophila]
MTNLTDYLQAAVNDKVINQAQAAKLQQVLSQPLPNSPTKLEPEIEEISRLLYLYQLDSNKMTRH